MKLYYTPGACSLSPHIVAEEAGVPIELVKVNLAAHKLENGDDYYAINPKGAVPALVTDDGQLLTEGPAIVQYIADRNSSSSIAPANGSFERYKLQEWLTFINGEIHKTFGPLFRSPSEEAKKNAIETIGKKFAFVEKSLSGRQFILGDKFTAADAYFFVMLTWAKKMGIEVSSALSQYFERVAARPKVHAAMKAEGLVS